jgi:hypothetical protein
MLEGLGLGDYVGHHFSCCFGTAKPATVIVLLFD